MTLVVDASVALKWFVDEPGSARAAALLTCADRLVAPDFIVAEVCNAAWRAVRAGTMLAAQQDHAAMRLPMIFDELVPAATLAQRAVTVSRALDRPVYDCLYLALSEQRDARLVTADRKLLGRLQGTEWEGRAVDLALTPPAPA